MNPSKLLPSIGSSSSIIKSIQNGFSFDSTTKKGVASSEKEEKKKVQYQTTLKKELLKIRSKTLKIEDFLKNNFLLNKKSFNIYRKQKENEQRSQSEKKLKKQKTKFGNIEIPSIPQFGFLDAIKKFIFFTFLGLAAPTLIKLVPKLVELGKNLQPMIKFLTDIGKGFLNGLVTFIDWGYKIQDSSKDTFKKIGGNQAEKKFDSFVNTLNTFIDLSILAGLTALDVGLDAEKYRRKLYENQKKSSGAKPRGNVKPTVGQGGKPGLGRGAAVTAGRGGAKNLGAKLSGGPFSKFAGPLKRFLGVAAPGVGAAIGVFDAKSRFESGDKLGGTLAATSAALDTFAAGVGIAAAATSVLALTGAGAAVPAALLSAAGIAQMIATGIDVVLLVRDLIKISFPDIPMISNGGRIKLYAEGGRIGERGRSIKVGKKVSKIVEKQQITPGKDVGGKSQILKLFPDSSPESARQTANASPWWKRWLGFDQDNTQTTKGKPANPFKALESTAKTLSKIPGPIGLLMSAGSLIPLGQKPSKDLGASFGNMIGRLTQDVIDNNINLSFSDIMKFISGYANGGDLRTANIIRENNVGEKIGSMVGRAINSMVSSQVDFAIRDIYKEISTIGKPEDSLTPSSGNAGSAGDGGGFDEPNIGSSEMDLFQRLVYAEAGGEGLLGMALVARSVLNRSGLIQSGKIGPGTFHSKGGSITEVINSNKNGTWQYTPIKNGRINEKLTGSQLNQSLKAIELAKDPIKLKELLKKEGLSEEQITKLIAATGFRNYAAGAGIDTSQQVNEINFKRHTFNTAGNSSLLVPKSVAISTSPRMISGIGAITASQIYPLSAGQGRDVSKEPGIDFTYKGGKTLALYPGKVVDIGSQYNSRTGRGYGNYILVESIDPNTGRKFTTLYAHFGNGKISVKKGDIIQAGTSLGAQPNANKRGYFTGSGSGEHTSADFYNPDGRTRYAGADKLISQILNTFSGKGTYPTQQVRAQNSTLLGIQNAMNTRDFGKISGVGSKGYLIIPGHAAGAGAPGERDLVKKLARNAYNNIKSKNPRSKVYLVDVDSMFPDTDDGWKDYLKWIDKKEKEGYEILEIHMDEKKGTGKGLIAPVNELNPVESHFAKTQGAYPRGFRDLGNPKRGASIFELGNMSDELRRTGGTKEQLDILTKPFEESVLNEFNQQLSFIPQQKQSTIAQGLNQEPSYNNFGAIAMVHHTTIIKEPIYIPMNGSGVNSINAPTSVLDFTPSLA